MTSSVASRYLNAALGVPSEETRRSHVLDQAVDDMVTDMIETIHIAYADPTWEAGQGRGQHHWIQEKVERWSLRKALGVYACLFEGAIWSA